MRDRIMGLFDALFKNRPKVTEKNVTKFEMLNGYTPKFTTFAGSIYEQELIRDAINARAVHISKLKFEILGSAKPAMQTKLKKAPNSFMTWSQFLSRYSTILDINNTAFICPIYDKYGDVVGIYPVLPMQCEIVMYGKTPYLVYTFNWGERAAIELDKCGIQTKFQYKSDFFGENNDPLTPTIDLIHIQNQGIQEGVKSAATYRFWAKVNNFSKVEDLKNERKRFSEENFSKDAEAGGILLFPNTYSEINQVKSSPFIVDAEEMKQIKENVFYHFMVNDDILQNKAYGDSWSAFYEGAIETFAIQFSEVVTKMLFTETELGYDNKVILTANRLQYMANKDKLQVTTQLVDRGILNRDEAREIWNLPPLPNGEGQEYIIRGEYWNANEKINEENNNEQND